MPEMAEEIVATEQVSEDAASVSAEGAGSAEQERESGEQAPDVQKMYDEAQKLIGKQGEELGQLRQQSKILELELEQTRLSKKLGATDEGSREQEKLDKEWQELKERAADDPTVALDAMERYAARVEERIKKQREELRQEFLAEIRDRDPSYLARKKEVDTLMQEMGINDREIAMRVLDKLDASRPPKNAPAQTPPGVPSTKRLVEEEPESSLDEKQLAVINAHMRATGLGGLDEAGIKEMQRRDIERRKRARRAS